MQMKKQSLVAARLRVIKSKIERKRINILYSYYLFLHTQNILYFFNFNIF